MADSQKVKGRITVAYKPKRSGTKKSALIRARRAASRAANGVNTSRTRAEREPVVDAPVRVGTRAIREEEVAEAIAPVLTEFSLVLEGLKISGPAANRTVKITVDYTAERTDSLSLDSLAEISRCDFGCSRSCGCERRVLPLRAGGLCRAQPPAEGAPPLGARPHPPGCGHRARRHRVPGPPPRGAGRGPGPGA